MFVFCFSGYESQIREQGWGLHHWDRCELKGTPTQMAPHPLQRAGGENGKKCSGTFQGWAACVKGALQASTFNCGASQTHDAVKSGSAEHTGSDVLKVCVCVCQEAIERKEKRARRFHFCSEESRGQRNVFLDKDMMKKGERSNDHGVRLLFTGSCLYRLCVC